MSKKQINEKIYLADSFVSVPDMKCSFFILQNTDEDKERIVVKLEDGRFKDIIVAVKNFHFTSETTNVLNFEYEILHNPYEKIPNVKNFELLIKATVKKIIAYALKCAEEMSKPKEELEPMKKKSTIKGK